ncbi:MAG TPA: PilZ domain-containing protein [Rhizorhapis sp.]|jgi:hypothetical protein
MTAQKLPSNDRQERLNTRCNLLMDVKLRRQGGNWFNARLSNLSLTGFRVQTFARLDLDSTIWVMLPGFDGRRAKIIGTRDHEADCLFERPLHAAIFDHLLLMNRLRA